VQLVEASDRLGGIARTASESMPNTALMADVLDWLERQVRRLDVDVQTSTRLSAGDIEAKHADVVIVANGTKYHVNGTQFGSPGQVPGGTDKPHVYTSLDAIGLTKEQAGDAAIVVDDVGDYEAIGVAEYLLSLGLSVRYVTPFATMAPPIEASFRAYSAQIRMCPTGRFTIHTLTHLLEIEDDEVQLMDLSGGRQWTAPASTVVLVTRQGGDRSLADALDGRVPHVVVTGDALVHRNLRAAIADGHRAAEAIT
jgi:hypothetical protein